MKKVLKRIIIILLVIVIAFGAYAGYVFGAYYRLPDNLTLEVKRNGENSHFDEDFALTPGDAYPEKWCVWVKSSRFSKEASIDF